MSRYAETLLLLATFAGLVAGSEPTQAERERRVKVALALAEPGKPAPAKLPAAKPLLGLDWFGDAKACECCASDKPCPCKTGECGAATCPGGCKHEMAPPPHRAAVVPKMSEVAPGVAGGYWKTVCGFDDRGRRICWQEWVPVQK